MFTLRSLLVLEVMLGAAVLVGVVQPTEAGRDERATQVREVLSVAGNGLCAMTDAQAAMTATRLDELMRERTGNRLGLDEFLATARVMKRTGASSRVRVYSEYRTFAEVCRELGALLLREQRLEREGRGPQVAAFLRKVRAARDAGRSEAEVQQMVREGYASGDLSPCPDELCRETQAEVACRLHVLVDGEMTLTEMARLRRMTKEVLLTTLATGRDTVVGLVRVGWL
jgi:hypothetical protein